MPFSNYEPEVIDVTDMEEEVAIFQNVHVVDFDPRQFSIPGVMGDDDDDSDDESTLSIDEAEILEGFLTPPTTPPRLTLHDLTTDDDDEVPIPAAETDSEMEFDDDIVWNPENFTYPRAFDLPENIVNIFETDRCNEVIMKRRPPRTTTIGKKHFATEFPLCRPCKRPSC